MFKQLKEVCFNHSNVQYKPVCPLY